MRNATETLTGETLDRSTFYATLVAGTATGESLVFGYVKRDGSITEQTVTEILEIVGTPGTSSHGFKGMTDRGPRTFNFHLMGA